MKVKIAIEKGESKEAAEELLYKALKAKRKAITTKHSERFEDPFVQKRAIKMNNEHKKMYANMLKEIFEVLGK